MTKAALRIALRVLVRPLLSPPASVRAQRRIAAALAVATRSAAGVEIEPARLGGIEAEVCRPGTAAAPRPAVLYLHGGAYYYGGPRTCRSITTHLAKAARADVYAIDYRLAPENPFPAALDDSFAAYRELVRNTDPAQVAIAGDSAGGGLALATALEAEEMGVPKPAALALICPWTDLTLSGDSLTANVRREPVLHPRTLPWAARLYAVDTPRHDPRLSPLYADLDGLPPLLIQVAERDLLRDDGVRLAERARSDGVETKLERFDDLWHDFQLHAGVLGDANEAIARIASFCELAWARVGAPA